MVVVAIQTENFNFVCLSYFILFVEFKIKVFEISIFVIQLMETIACEVSDAGSQ